MKVRFKRFSTGACVLQKSSTGSACYNLFAARCVTLEPAATRPGETDIGFCFSEKYIGKIYSRSRVTLKSIMVGRGIIDSDYRGNVRMILYNFSDKRLEFNTGDCIAQILFQKNRKSPKFIEVSSFDDFSTQQSDKGFGSTGI